MARMNTVHLPWEEIDFVLLDLDGTLLDKFFDDYFWEELIPEKFAALNNISVEAAKNKILPMYQSKERQLAWSDIHFWSKRFGLDIQALKKTVTDRIRVHDGVILFLEFLKANKKKVSVLTNAHSKSVEIKLSHAPLRPFFDHIISANEVGFPKEATGYWDAAQVLVGFDPARSLFVDDNEEIVRMAQQFGIRHLLYKSYASSQILPKDSETFMTIRNFQEIY
ncbi:MAG: HAD-IA family hydrolase [Nitrospirota bacterium]|mgnify:CR=1 FL=1